MASGLISPLRSVLMPSDRRNENQIAAEIHYALQTRRYAYEFDTLIQAGAHALNHMALPMTPRFKTTSWYCLIWEPTLTATPAMPLEQWQSERNDKQKDIYQVCLEAQLVPKKCQAWHDRRGTG